MGRRDLPNQEAQHGTLYWICSCQPDDEELDLQINDLKAAGCLKTVQTGDTLVVWRLDRLGRSMQHPVSVITNLKARGIAFRSLRDEVIDTTTASGELVFNILAAHAQFEAELISERTQAGLSAARARGRRGIGVNIRSWIFVP